MVIALAARIKVDIATPIPAFRRPDGPDGMPPPAHTGLIRDFRRPRTDWNERPVRESAVNARRTVPGFESTATWQARDLAS